MDNEQCSNSLILDNYEFSTKHRMTIEVCTMICANIGKFQEKSRGIVYSKFYIPEILTILMKSMFRSIR